MRILLPVAGAALLVRTTVGFAEYQMLIPNGLAGRDPTSGISCSPLGHENCREGAARNKFGLAFKAAGLKWTKELCEADSDGDGESNGSELGDPCCLWSPTNTNPKGFRVTNLSNPGDPSEDGSKVAPKCEDIVDAVETAEAASEDQKSKSYSDAKEGTQPPANTTEAPAETTTAEDAVVADAPKITTTETPVTTKTPMIELMGTEATVDTDKFMTIKVPSTVPPAVTQQQLQTDKPEMTNEVTPEKTVPPSTVTEALSFDCIDYNTACFDEIPCCGANNECTIAPWEGPGEKLCLPSPPVCYNAGERCAGADGYEYVPYAACCNSSEVCIEDKKKGWGYFCIVPPPGYFDISSEDTGKTNTPSGLTSSPAIATEATADVVGPSSERQQHRIFDPRRR